MFKLNPYQSIQKQNYVYQVYWWNWIKFTFFKSCGSFGWNSSYFIIFLEIEQISPFQWFCEWICVTHHSTLKSSHLIETIQELKQISQNHAVFTLPWQSSELFGFKSDYLVIPKFYPIIVESSHLIEIFHGLSQSKKAESNSITNQIIFWIGTNWAKLTNFQNFHFHCDDNWIFMSFQWDLKDFTWFNSICRIFIIFEDIPNLVE